MRLTTLHLDLVRGGGKFNVQLVPLSGIPNPTDPQAILNHSQPHLTAPQQANEFPRHARIIRHLNRDPPRLDDRQLVTNQLDLGLGVEHPQDTIVQRARVVLLLGIVAPLELTLARIRHFGAHVAPAGRWVVGAEVGVV